MLDLLVLDVEPCLLVACDTGRALCLFSLSSIPESELDEAACSMVPAVLRSSRRMRGTRASCTLRLFDDDPDEDDKDDDADKGSLLALPLVRDVFTF